MRTVEVELVKSGHVLGSILKVELMRFLDGLDVKCAEERKVNVFEGWHCCQWREDGFNVREAGGGGIPELQFSDSSN